MKSLKLVFTITMVLTVCPCGAKNSSMADTENIKNKVTKIDSIKNTQDFSDLIKTVYEKFVFAIDANSEVFAHPEQYFTAYALRKLKDSYEFDCENGDCYAYYELRTQQQDSKPYTNGESHIICIESEGDYWYIVKYSDMGWSGKTRIKITDGKIDDFERCVEK